MVLIKGARKTFLKLRMGKKIVPFGDIPADDLVPLRRTDGALHCRAAGGAIGEAVVDERPGAGERAGVGGILRLRPGGHHQPDIDGQRRRGEERHEADADEDHRHPGLVEQAPGRVPKATRVGMHCHDRRPLVRRPRLHELRLIRSFGGPHLVRGLVEGHLQPQHPRNIDVDVF